MKNLLDLQPHKVSADLKGYVIGIYGQPGEKSYAGKFG